MQLLSTSTINLARYKRFFAFGCSCTHYQWSTWADIIGSQFGDQYYNYGLAGGGNMFIALQVAEAHARYNFSESDLVIVMWSSVTRLDSYTVAKWGWIRTGNIYSGNLFKEFPGSDKYVQHCTDDRFFLLRDIGLAATVQTVLLQTGCDWDFLSMIPWTVHEMINEPMSQNDSADILSVYKNTVESVKPSLFSTVLHETWDRGHKIITATYLDAHPLPSEAAAYVQLTYPGMSIPADVLQKANSESESLIGKTFTTQPKYANTLANRKPVTRL